MSIVSVSEAARLSGRGRATLYRMFDKGELSRSVSPDGSTGVDVSELIRVFGQLKFPVGVQAPNGVYQGVRETAVETVSRVSGQREVDTISDFAQKVATFPGQAAETVDSEADIPVIQEQTDPDRVKMAQMQERLAAYEQQIELLKRIADLERDVRRDTTAALKAQLADREVVIKALETQVLQLGYTKKVEQGEVKSTESGKSWLARIFKTF